MPEKTNDEDIKQTRSTEDKDLQASMKLVTQEKNTLLYEFEQLTQHYSDLQEQRNPDSYEAAQAMDKHLSQPQSSVVRVQASAYSDAQLCGETDKGFLCSFCDRRFTNKLGRDGHEKRHDMVLPKYRCNEKDCGKIFASKDTLHKHIGSVY